MKAFNKTIASSLGERCKILNIMFLVTLVALAMPFNAYGKACKSNQSDKTTVCHLTNSETNPVVEICVSNNAVDKHVNKHGDYLQITYYEDNDGDTYGSDVTTLACVKPDGFADRSGDCNDNEPDINPDALELCADLGIDNNCNGSDADFTDDFCPWHFRQGAPNPTNPITRANCSQLFPCGVPDTNLFNQIGILDPGATLYFESGIYTPSDGGNGQKWVQLSDNMKVIGRSANWAADATDTFRPQIFGGLIWGSQTGPVVASGEVLHMIIDNQDQKIAQSIFQYFGNPVVLGLGATGDLIIINSEVNASSHDTSTISVFADSNASITDTTINSKITDPGNTLFAGINDAVGVFAPVGSVNTLRSDINVTNDKNAQGVPVGSFGIRVDNGGSVMIDDSKINLFAKGHADGSGAFTGARAINNFGVGPTTILNSQINSKTLGHANNGGFSNSFAIITNNPVAVTSSLVNSRTEGSAMNGSIDGAISRVILAGNNDVNITSSTLKSSTIGDAIDSLAGANSNVISTDGNIIIESSTLTTNTEGTANNSVFGTNSNTILMFGGTAKSVVVNNNSMLETITKGDALNNSDVGASAGAIVTNGNVKISSSNISARTEGMEISSPIGVLVVTINCLGPGADLIFTGAQSTVSSTTIGNGLSIPVDGFSTINNTSVPQSTCTDNFSTFICN